MSNAHQQWLPESARYDVLTGNQEKALNTLKRIAAENNVPMPLGKLVVARQVKHYLKYTCVYCLLIYIIYTIYGFLYLDFISWKIVKTLLIIQCVIGVESALACECFHAEIMIH